MGVCGDSDGSGDDGGSSRTSAVFGAQCFVTVRVILYTKGEKNTKDILSFCHLGSHRWQLF